MKTAKKIISTILALTLCMTLCFAMSSCNNAVKIEGTTWVVSEVLNNDGTKMTGEEMASVMGEMSYEFKAGGVFTANAAGQSVDGTWTQDGTTVTIESNGQESTANVKGNEMTIEANGATTTLTKK